MVTSLQKQLASIASKSSHQLDLKAQSSLHSKSLLYEPKIASKQDYDTIYLSCLEGFEELCVLDKRFYAFKDNLFSLQSKAQSRVHMTEKENETLNSYIDRFLSLVSSRLLVKPALKATEWLVRRYHAHEHNISSMVLAFLPYHANQNVSAFAALLSIIPSSKLPPAFRFLHPYIRTGSPLPTSVIVYTATHDESFFTTFNQFYIHMVKQKTHTQALITFWASIVAQATHNILDAALTGRKEVRNQRQEDAIIRILSVLNQGFALAADKDMAMACMMITLIFCSKADLNNEVIDGLMTTISSLQNPRIQEEVLSSLAILAQVRDGTDFPKAVLKRLTKIPHVSQLLRNLSTKTRTEKLIYGLLTGFFRNRHPDLNQVATVVECAELLSDAQLSKALEFAIRILKSDEPVISQAKFCTQFITKLAQIRAKHTVISETLARLEMTEEDLERICGSSVALIKAPESAPTEPAPTIPSKTVSRSFSEQLQALPSTSSTSFLAAFEVEAFKPLARLFEEALGDEGKLNEFCNASIFKSGGSPNELTYVSFLLRLIGSSGAATSRLGAIELLRTWFRSENKPGLRAQLALPYLFAALSDFSKSVRTAALAAINEAVPCLKQSSPEPWSYNQVYGTSLQELTSPSSVEISSFLTDVILPHASTLALDQAQIQALLTQAFASEIVSSKKSKSSPISAAYSFIASHVAAVPLLAIRLTLLPFLERNGQVKTKLKGATPVIASIKEWASIPQDLLQAQCQLQSVEISTLSSLYFSALSGLDVECMTFLHVLIKNLPSIREDIARAAVDRLVHIWPTLGTSLKETFTSSLLDIATDRREGLNASRSMATETLYAVDLLVSSLLHFIENLPKSSDIQNEPLPTKKRKIGENEQENKNSQTQQNLVNALASYDLALGLVQKSSPLSDPSVMSALFSILEELHRFGAKANSSLVYLQAQTLTCLLDTVQHLKNLQGFRMDLSLIRTDLLVDCVRQAPSSQVLSSALLLISSLASWVPEIVLHGVMPIFTFIGNTILRQSDDFSIHVVNETLAHIVPPLVSSLQSKNQAVVSGTAELLLSFTSAFDHIPSHRRLHLFETLIQTLGPSESLYAVALILAERYPTDDDVIRFVQSLMVKFGPAVTLSTLNHYAQALLDLVYKRVGSAQVLVRFEDRSEADIEKLMVNLIHFLSVLIDNGKTRRCVNVFLRQSESSEDAPHQQFSQFIQDLINLGQACKPSAAASRPCRSVLSAAFRLLPPLDLVKAAQVFLSSAHNQEGLDVLHVFLRSLDLEFKRLKNVNTETSVAFTSLLLPLSAAASSELHTIKSASIVCIDEIVRRFGKVNPEPVSSVAQIMAGPDALGQADSSIRVASLYCLSSCIEIIKEEAIPLLPTVFPRIMEYLGERAKGENELFVPCYTFLVSVCESIPFMFSGQYLESSLRLVHQSTALTLTAEEEDARKQFLEVVVLHIGPSEAFAAISRTFADALAAGPSAVVIQLKTLQLVIQRHANATVLKHASTLFNLFRQAFGARLVMHQSGASVAEITKVEDLTIDAAMAMVLKLNDSVFRPFFAALVQWAKSPSGVGSGDVALARKCYGTTVFRFSEAMFSRLKALVVGYSSDILDLATDVLLNGSLSDQNDTDLIKFCLAALQQSFEHDQDDFWQAPTNFDQIVSPLVGFLDRFARSSSSSPALDSAATETIEKAAIAAIVEFAVTATSSDHHKEINTILIRGMRSENSRVRLAVVKCQRELTDRLGEEWLSLLPELLPIISELQEDDDEKVEVETLKWIKMMEKTLGESMDSMLR